MNEGPLVNGLDEINTMNIVLMQCTDFSMELSRFQRLAMKALLLVPLSIRDLVTIHPGY